MTIHVRELTKVYRVPVKDAGLMGSMRSLVARRFREVRAVDAVSFDIEAGARIGFLGPNGAGKTTTLKMLSGLLHPTSGEVRVLGFEPRRRPTELLRSITLVMGQKQQLLWDLPPMETFSLNRALYGIPAPQFRETLAELIELLDIGDIVSQPTRNLSLGQRMRCELAAALLHRPKVLFLDEPTIGLDVAVQAQVRRFIDAYNRRYGATVMLTSHDMNDVGQLARRVILIDQGKIRFDGSLSELQVRFGSGRKVAVRGPGEILEPLGFARDPDARFVKIVPPSEVNRVLADVLAAIPTADVTVLEPPLDEVLTRAFADREGRA